VKDGANGVEMEAIYRFADMRCMKGVLILPLPPFLPPLRFAICFAVEPGRWISYRFGRLDIRFLPRRAISFVATFVTVSCADGAC
jgi:hypothetical protein